MNNKTGYFQNNIDMASGIPLGGLGSGSVELRADGKFHEWQICNNAPWAGLKYPVAQPIVDGKDACFLLRCETADSKTIVRQLYHDPGRWELLWNGAQPYLFPWLKQITKIRHEGRFPFVRLDYIDEALPIEVSQEAFSPFVPHDSRNSAWPLAYFIFKLHNRSDKECRTSLVFTLKNLVGYDVTERILHNNVVTDRQGNTLIVMKGEKVDSEHPTSGSMVIGALGKDVTYMAGWDDTAGDFGFSRFMNNFKKTGVLCNQKSAVTGQKVIPPDLIAGEIINIKAALCKTITLKPGQTEEVVFVLSWYFPNHISSEKQHIGHMYTNWFNDAEDVALQGIAKFSMLKENSKMFCDILYNSSLEGWLCDALNAQLTTFIKSSIWSKNGMFGIWEGLGCAMLNTVCVDYYASFAVIMFFPELEKQKLRDMALTQNVTGRIFDGWRGGNFDKKAVTYHFADNMCQFVLMACRYWQWTGDKKFLSEIWPNVKLAVELMIRSDKNQDGLPDLVEAAKLSRKEGPSGGIWKTIESRMCQNTYDGFRLPATQSYLCSLNIAALFAASKMAAHIDGKNDNKRYNSLAEKASLTFEKLFWNGEYYRHFIDIEKSIKDEGCLADQITGQWYSRILGLPSPHKPSNVHKALKSIFKYNRHTEEGLLNGSDPYGARTLWEPYIVRGWGETASSQWGVPWTGTEYAVAAMMINEGLIREGLLVIKDVHERHAREGSQYSHYECGPHYYRPMGVWSIISYFQRVNYNIVERALVISSSDLKSYSGLFLVPNAWGSVKAGVSGKVQIIMLTLKSGQLDFSRLMFPGHGISDIKVSVNGKKVSCLKEKLKDYVVYLLNLPVRIGAKDSLKIEMMFNRIKRKKKTIV